MKIEDLNPLVESYINGRFQLETEKKLSNLLYEFDTNKILKKEIYRLQRIKQNEESHKINWKTLLIVELQNKNELQYALQWAATVKDALLDPETADLYLLIIFDDKIIDISVDECYSIESSEKYCRKYIKRPGQSPIDLLDRTFLSILEDAEESGDGLDPISTAMAVTEAKYSWFTEDEQKKWRSALLSNMSGNELLENLFPEIKN
ncbi:ABC-three component system middle component 1 [Sphingobacterium faecium]|uniref:ABC-three component system middle component 1 n=1 Tax=Sphingobacterium faecium TaxID=34087 RepID=UPI00320B5FFE